MSAPVSGISTHWIPGKGVIPWKELIDTVRRNGYSGPFIYETSKPKEQSVDKAIDELAQSIRDLLSPGATPS